MKSYLLRRLWQSLLVIFGVSVVVFLILHLTGDPAALLLPPDATAEDIARFRTAMGFDDPVAVQRRLVAYRNQTAPVLEWFDRLGIVTRIPAIGGVDEIAGRVRQAIGQ